MESYTLDQIILRRFDNLKITSLENIIEVDLCHLTGNNSNSVNLLRYIFVDRLFCYRVNTGHKVIQLEFAAVCGCYSLIDTVTADGKLNTVNLSVLTCLYNLTRAVAYLHFDKAADRVADLLSISDHILNAVAILMDTVRPYDNTSADTVLFCGCDGKFLARSFLHRNSQFVSADRERNAVNICREIVIAKHTVCIGESCNILVTPEKLEYGKGYSLVEVQAPYGYVLDSTPVYFDVAEEHSSDEGGITVIKVDKPNMAQKGTVSIEKTGEVFSGVNISGEENADVIYQPVYEVKGLAGAVYEITAARKIA